MRSKDATITVYLLIIISMFAAVFMQDRAPGIDLVAVWIAFAASLCVLRFVVFNYISNQRYIRARHRGEDYAAVTGGKWFVIAGAEDLDSVMGVSIISVWGLVVTLVALAGFFPAMYFSLNPQEAPILTGVDPVYLFFSAIGFAGGYVALVLVKGRFRRL